VLNPAATLTDACATQPTHPLPLPSARIQHYVDRAEDIFARYGAGGVKEGTPLFLYVAFAHTHTPMGYTDAGYGLDLLGQSWRWLLLTRCL